MRCGHDKGGAGAAKDGRHGHTREGNRDGASAAVRMRRPKLVRARGGRSGGAAPIGFHGRSHGGEQRKRRRRGPIPNGKVRSGPG
jgi:hypothetical protein